MSNRAKKIIRTLLFTVIPGLLVAGLVLGANTYYSMDQNRIITEDDQEFQGTVYMGQMQFGEDSGSISWIDMPVSSSPAVGSPHSYSAQLDDIDLLTVYGEADGSGSVQNTGVGVGTTSPSSK